MDPLDTVRELEKITSLEEPSDAIIGSLESLAYSILDSMWFSTLEPRQTRIYNAAAHVWELCFPEDSEELTEVGCRVSQNVLHVFCALTAVFPRAHGEDQRILDVIMQAVSESSSIANQLQGFRIMKHVCRRNEPFREALVNEYQVVPAMVALLRADGPTPCADYVREWSSAMKSLMLNDDSSVSYNRVWERMQALYHEQDVICHLCGLLHDYKDDGTLNAIVVLLGTMVAVKGKFDQGIIEAGIMGEITKIFAENISCGLLVKHTLTLLRGLCCEVSDIKDIGGDYHLVRCLLKKVIRGYYDRPDVIELTMSCLGYLTLRSPQNVDELIKLDGIPKLLELAEEYMEEAPVVKNICFIFRNVVAHGGPDARAEILNLRGGDIMQQIGEDNPELVNLFVLPLLKELEVETGLKPTETHKLLVDIYTPAITQWINQ